MSLFKVSILTPDKILFQSNEVKELVLPTTTGKMGVLANHSPLMTGIDIGQMLISDSSNSNWISIAVFGGFALIKENTVMLVVSEATFGSEINVEEAEKNFFEAKESVTKAKDQKEKMETTLALKRARACYEAARTL
jgi:F-type H+-transporting ATPase subunit epsilon